MIIDVHGHYTTAPAPLQAWRDQQVAALSGGPEPDPAGPVITDDEIRETIEKNQLRLMDERGIDVQYVLFPDEGHGWRKEANRVRSTLEMTRFFREHLLGERP